jgi:hypothetical protein
MKHRVLAILAAVLTLIPGIARAQSEAALRQELRDESVRATRDPSLTTRLAVPLVDFTAVLAKDKKTATAKAGFDFGDDVVAEFGVTGAFDEASDRTVLTSLRELTPGSKLWAAFNWRRFRVTAIHAKLEQVCREAAWAAGRSFTDFDCRESTLSETSFAARLQPEAIESNVPLVCVDFARALATAVDVVHGQSAIDCRRSEAEILQAVRALGSKAKDQLSMSYAARHAAAPTDVAKLAICNEFRRSERLPPVAKCDASAVAKDANWNRSWQARFDAATVADITDRVRAEQNAQMVEVCAEVDRARGLTPSGRTSCADQSELFTKSFKERYAAAYRWAYTPIVGLRYDTSRNNFNFVDAALVPQPTQTETTHAWTGTLGVLTPGDTLFALNYANSRGWKAQPKRNVCQPLTNTNATTCAERIIGAPKPDNRQQTELEIKRKLTTSFAAGFYLTRDHELEAWGVEVPIYFLKNETGGLSGGIVAGYRSDEKRYDLSVFIGQAFDLFGDK